MTFDVYTYQFQRILSPTQTEGNSAGYNNEYCSDADWHNKQEIFGNIFKQELKAPQLSIVNEIGESLGHKTYFADQGIILMRIAKEKIVEWEDINMQTRKDTIFPANFVLIDNRDGIQRMLIQRSSKTWRKTADLMHILCNALDNAMTPHGMHFVMGDTPVYHYKSVWDVVKAAPHGISRIEFKFPAPNLGRLANLADALNLVREETGGGIETQLQAPKNSSLMLKEGGQVDSMIRLSSAEGSIVRIKRKGERSYIPVGGDSANSVCAAIDDNDVKKLAQNGFKELPEGLVWSLNGIKTLYE